MTKMTEDRDANRNGPYVKIVSFAPLAFFPFSALTSSVSLPYDQGISIKIILFYS